MKKTLVILAALFALTAGFTTARASFDVTYNNTIYTLEVTTDQFAEIPGYMMSTPWWGDEAIASDFAFRVGEGLGLWWDGTYGTHYMWKGPNFAFTVWDYQYGLVGMYHITKSRDSVYPYYESNGGTCVSASLWVDLPYVYVLSSTPVPEPSTWIAGALLVCPFGWLAFGSLRRQRREGVLTSDTNPARR